MVVIAERGVMPRMRQVQGRKEGKEGWETKDAGGNKRTNKQTNDVNVNAE
jgi:hypothetical protein